CRRQRRKRSWRSSTPPRSRPWRTTACASASPTLAWTSRRASSRRRKRLALSTRPRSRSGGRSSRRRTSNRSERTLYASGHNRPLTYIPLPRHQRPDHEKIEQIGGDAGGEGGCVVTEVVVHDAGEPAAGRHAAAAHQQQGRHPPAGFAGGIVLADGEHVGRNERAEADAERARN